MISAVNFAALTPAARARVVALRMAGHRAVYARRRFTGWQVGITDGNGWALVLG